MFRKKSTDEGSNFWISYADLMAGLLFVFILLLGAIVSKSTIIKNDLQEKENRLSKLSDTLKSQEKAMKENKKLLIQKEKDLQEKKHALNKNIKRLKLQEEEITKLTRMLAESNAKTQALDKQIVVIRKILNDTNATLQKTVKTYESKVLLLTHQLNDLNKTVKDKDTALQKTVKTYDSKVLLLTHQLNDLNKTVKDKDIKLRKILNTLDEKETKYDALIAKLQKQKAKIKSLTGIKFKVITALKEALGNKINIDRKNGSLKFASNILFDKGSSVLKEGAKEELKKVFEEYISTLMTDPQIQPHLDKIIIEGHTDSDGGYLYNLNLSQKRAYAVMNYLLTLDITRKYNLKPLLVASGRAYLDAVKVNGIEDKDASRRIEVKFRLKNENAMHEIEKVLDAE